MEKLIEGLNEDLSAEWGTIMRYTLQSARATGIRGVEFREFLQKEIGDELRHATFLTEVISDLNGKASMSPKPVDDLSGIEDMVRQDLQMEKDDVRQYSEHARWAEELGETELKVRLEEMAADESRHARGLGRILKGL